MHMDNKIDIVQNYGYNENTMGCSEVQVILLTYKIRSLTNHFRYHKNDEHSRRGLLKMSSKRKKLLKYLKNKNLKRYKDILHALNLRK